MTAHGKMMLSTALALSLSLLAPSAPNAQGAGVVADADPSMPARVAEISRALGPKKMDRLTGRADEFVEDLARAIAGFDRRKATFRPDRLPKPVRGSLVGYRDSLDERAGAEDQLAEDLLAVARWRLTTRAQALDQELTKAKRGLEAIKSMLARLKAVSVDPGAHYPVRIAYLRVTKAGELETVREQVPSAKELDPAMARIDAALEPLVEYMRKRVDELNGKRRALEVLDASFAQMLAGIASPTH